ncbi:MAG TPA: thioredoxin family protein [Candidatus Nanoarchaeia archaeon]|nr:thioredoxin family protein [Candidatus Nanoarchaeia archaeon]
MNNRHVGLCIAVVLIVATLIYLERSNAEMPVVFYSDAEDGTAPELAGIVGYINTDDSFRLKDHIGKEVILIDFWTYTCINCQRTLPYLTAWHEKYADQGLLIVGVHTPEFDFEKKTENVQKAVKQFGIRYPVVQDNDYQTWRAYANNYWPHKYLIDIHGNIVYDHVGEGGYKETEEKIQELLKERMNVLGLRENVAADFVPVTSVSSYAQSPETYFGSARNTNLGNGERGVVGVQDFTLPRNGNPNTLYLNGHWDIQPEFARTVDRAASILFYYGAKNVYMVARAEPAVNIQVLLDGKLVGRAAGRDLVNGYVTVRDEKLYELISHDEPGAHVLQLVPDRPGLDAFTFTFG